MSTVSPRRLRTGLLVAVLALALAPGCGDSAPQPVLTEVEGTITLDGKPISKASIAFYPDDFPSEQWASSGLSDDAGRYRLLCVNSGEGACVGRHRVTVQEHKEESDIKIDPQTGRTLPGAGKLTPKKPSRFPAVYAGRDTTPLVIEVTAGQKVYDLQLRTTK